MIRKIEIFSALIILLGIIFYYWILENHFSGRKIVLSVLIILNIIGLIVNIKHFYSFRKGTYVSYIGYILQQWLLWPLQ
jgi:hypothetical protein